MVLSISLACDLQGFQISWDSSQVPLPFEYVYQRGDTFSLPLSIPGHYYSNMISNYNASITGFAVKKRQIINH